jgi:ureidoglycolate lyase
MRKEKIKELSHKDFAKYGSYANMINPDTEKLGAEPIEFYRDMVRLDLGGRTLASFSVCRVCKRPPIVDVTEFHNYTGEGILPLDADAHPYGPGPARQNRNLPRTQGNFRLSAPRRMAPCSLRA